MHLLKAQVASRIEHQKMLDRLEATNGNDDAGDDDVDNKTQQPALQPSHPGTEKTPSKMTIAVTTLPDFFCDVPRTCTMHASLKY